MNRSAIDLQSFISNVQRKMLDFLVLTLIEGYSACRISGIFWYLHVRSKCRNVNAGVNMSRQTTINVENKHN